jgi:hypothetical protein
MSNDDEKYIYEINTDDSVGELMGQIINKRFKKIKK